MTMGTVPLRHAAQVLVSNVDKKSADGDPGARLVNYTDVYYNGEITADMPFMEATATPVQVRKFRVMPGDSIITKDSETPDDIGVPAYITTATPDMVCGYHLAILRPREGIHPKYLYWALASNETREQLSVAANGMTRSGLTYDAIQSARIHVPEVDEQRRIADFLDDQTTRIDQIIAARERQRGLLDQERRSLLDQVVLGVGPATWLPLKRLLSEVDVRAGVSASPDDLLSVSIHRGVVPRSTITDDLPRADLLDRYKVVQSGDLVLNRMRAFQGAIGVSLGAGIVSPDYAVLRCNSELLPAFAHFMFRSPWFAGEMAARIRGIGSADLGAARTPRINVSDLMEIRVPAPPVSLQAEVVSVLESAQDATTAHVGLLNDHVLLLQEFKRSLISEAVSGELEVTSARGRGVPA